MKCRKRRSRAESCSYNSDHQSSGSYRAKHVISNSNDYVQWLEIRNIPRDMKWYQLKDFIIDVCHVRVNHVEVLYNDDRQRIGIGVVKLPSMWHAMKARQYIHGRLIEQKMISCEIIKNMVDYFNDIHYRTGVNILKFQTFDRYSKREIGSSSIPALRRLRIDENETCNKVLVKNLPTVSIRNIKSVFELCGAVEFIVPHIGSDGCFNGEAVIEYRHSFEAVQAMLMLDSVKYHGRELKIKMFKNDSIERNPNGANGLPFGIKRVGNGLGDRGEPIFSFTSLYQSRNAGLAEIDPQFMDIDRAVVERFGVPDEYAVFEPELEYPHEDANDQNVIAHDDVDLYWEDRKIASPVSSTISEDILLPAPDSPTTEICQNQIKFGSSYSSLPSVVGTTPKCIPLIRKEVKYRLIPIDLPHIIPVKKYTVERMVMGTLDPRIFVSASSNGETLTTSSLVAGPSTRSNMTLSITKLN